MATLYAGFDSDSYPGDAAMESLFKNTCLKWCGFYLNGAAGDAWFGHYQKVKGLGWGVAPLYVGGATYLGDEHKVENPLFANLRADSVLDHNGTIKNPDKSEWISRSLITALAKDGMWAGDTLNIEERFKRERNVQWRWHLFELGKQAGRTAVVSANANGIKPPTAIYLDMESQPEKGFPPKGLWWFDEWWDYYRGWHWHVENTMGYRTGLYSNPHLLYLGLTEYLKVSDLFGRPNPNRYPYIWESRTPLYAWAGQKTGAGRRYFTVTDKGIYESGHTDSGGPTYTPSGRPLQQDPQTEEFKGTPLHASTWQFATNIYFNWQDKQKTTQQWKSQWADLSFSIYRDPGRPD